MTRRGWIVLLAAAWLFPVCRSGDAAGAKVRPAARAGQFYPYSPAELRSEVRAFLSRAVTPGLVPERSDVIGLWVPHAGYAYSGAIAANAYKAVQGKAYDVVCLIGPSHYADVGAAALADWDSLSTPLGRIAVDRALGRALDASSPLVSVIPGVDAEEHSIEVQLPFIQTLLPGAKVLPVMVRDMPLAACESLARSIAETLRGRRALLVASSDMSHYPPQDGARRADGEMLETVSRFDAGRVLRLESDLRGRGIPGMACSLCGSSALAVVMLASKILGADRAAVLPYANSGDVSGERDRVVGYGAAVFHRPAATSNQGGASVDSENIPFTAEQKKALFRIARESIQAALAGERPPEPGPLDGPLALPRGVFVTLNNKGRLRGCIGHFEPDLPLAEIVSQMAAAAATQDYRFTADPVTEAEMGKIDIKISILSPLRKIRSVEEIEVGKHGIWIRSGSRSGTYLPEVATELGWNREQFLTSCCEDKAGLAPDAWKKGADIYIYTSLVLSEK